MPSAKSTAIVPFAPATLATTPTLDPEFDLARKWVAMMRRSKQAHLATQVMLGQEIVRLRNVFGTAQGKRTDLAETSPNVSEKLAWPDRLKRELGITDDTARTCERMWTAAAPRLKRLFGKEKEMRGRAQEVFGQLLTMPLSAMDAATQDALYKVTHKLADGKTQAELLDALGFAKKKPGSAAKGGDKGGSKAARSPSDPTEAAVTLWAPIIRELAEEGITEKSWRHLPAEGEVSLHSLRLLIGALHEGLAAAKPAKPKA